MHWFGCSPRAIFILFILSLFSSSLVGCGDASEFSFLSPLGLMTSVEASGADLVVVNATLHGSRVEAGEKVSVSCALRNNGRDVAPTTRLKYYFSWDDVFDGADKYLSYDKVSSLAPGSESAESANLRAPKGTVAGKYYILFVADAASQLLETDESNNVVALPIGVGMELDEANTSNENAPDLLIENASAETYQLSAGEKVYVTVDVHNQGATAAVPSRIKYYLSEDDQFDSNDRYLNYDKVGSLESGASSKEDSNLRIPASTIDGNYYFLIVADVDFAIRESDERNNTVAIPMVVGEASIGGSADLIIENASLSQSTIRPGEQLAASSIVRNTGDGFVGITKLKYYLSRDTIVDQYDTVISYDLVNSLGPSGSSLESAQLRIHDNTDGGDWFVLLAVDSDNVAMESNEDNNLVSLTLAIDLDNADAPLPDLVVQNATTNKASALANEQVLVEVTISNMGPVAAGGSRLKYFFSTDELYQGADKYLNYDNVNTINSMGGGAENANLRIPAETEDGDYFILLVVDANEMVEERIESNNVTALPIYVGEVEGPVLEEDEEEDGPDLVVQNASIEFSTVRPNERLDLGLQVVNVGTENAPQTRVKYYISRDRSFDSTDKYVGYDRVNALAVNESGEEDAKPRIPSDWMGGTWYLVLVADANDDVAEASEYNNQVSIPFEVLLDDPTSNKADVVIIAYDDVETSVREGTNLDTEFTIMNSGGEAAPESRMKLYLSGDERFDETDIYLAYKQVPELIPNETVTVTSSYRIPVGVGDNTYYILAILDVNRDVEESYESNNQQTIPLEVSVNGMSNPTYRFTCPSYTATDDSLVDHSTIASFNVLHLGWENQKDFNALACIMSHFSLIGLNEVESESALIQLTDILNATTGLTWAYHISEHAVGNAHGTEFYAYIWRTDVVSMTSTIGFFPDAQEVIKREPYGANFKMGEFDFTFVVFHQRCGNTVAVRRAEAVHSIEIYNYFQNANGSENDVFIGGDFNLPGNDVSFTLVGVDGVDYVIDPEQKTSISAAGLVNSFDNIFYSTTYSSEILGNGVFDFTVGNYSLLHRTVSDHLPVWISVDTSTDDD